MSRILFSINLNFGCSSFDNIWLFYKIFIYIYILGYKYDIKPSLGWCFQYWAKIWKSQVSSLFLLSDRSDDIGWIFPGPSPPEWCWVEGTSHRCRPRAAVRKAHWFMDVYGSNVLAIKYPGLNEHRCPWNPWFPSERKIIYAWCCFVFFFRIYATWQERNYCFCWWVKQSNIPFAEMQFSSPSTIALALAFLVDVYLHKPWCFARSWLTIEPPFEGTSSSKKR